MANARSNQACAACKHQRQKCSPDCAFARYFPPHRQEQFKAVQSLYGTTNFLKKYHAVAAEDRDVFVNTMVFDAVNRQQHPARGSYAYINGLRRELEAARRRLRATQEIMVQLQRQVQLQQELTTQLLQVQMMPPQFRREMVGPEWMGGFGWQSLVRRRAAAVEANGELIGGRDVGDVCEEDVVAHRRKRAKAGVTV